MKKSYILFVLAIAWCGIMYAQSGIINTIAGNGVPGYGGDNGAATAAQIDTANNVAVDDSMNIYIADSYNNRIRKVYAATGKIVTICGTGAAGYTDSGQAIYAGIWYPMGIKVDTAHNVYFGDANNDVVRKITGATNIITTIAGNGNTGYTGDDSLAINATFSWIAGIALDDTGNVYIADQVNNVIRKIRVSTGIITTVAGNGYNYGTGKGGYSGDGGPATAAELNNPTGVAIDGLGNMYIADYQNNVVRKVSSNGIMSTYCGNGSAGYNGDDLPKDVIALDSLTGICTDNANNVYIADANNSRVCMVNAMDSICYLVAGDDTNAFTYYGDGGLGIFAGLNYPSDVAVDPKGNVYIADVDNFRIRYVTSYALALKPIVHPGQVTLFPNPASNEITLMFPVQSAISGNTALSIMDMTGREILKSSTMVKPGTQFSINVSSFSSGIYFVRLQGRNQAPQTCKFVKE
jgi:hypothetical protein